MFRRNTSSSVINPTNGQRADAAVDDQGRILVVGSLSAGSSQSVRNDKTQTVQSASNGTAGNTSMDQYGRIYVAPYCSPQEVQQLDSGAFSAAGGNSFGGAFGSGVRWYITGITFVHDNAVASRMSLSDGTSTIARAAFSAAGASIHYTYPTPIRTAANGTFNCDLSNAGQCFIHIYGWTSTV